MQAQQVAIANQIIQALRETHVVNEVINNTINQVQSLLQVYCYLTVQSPVSQVVGAQYCSTACCIAPHQTLCAAWEGDLATGQIILDSQINHLLPADCLENFPESYRGAVMIVPLLSGNRYLGAMGLYSGVLDRQWTTEEVAFGRAIADHLAILVEQAWLRQCVQHTPTVIDSQTNQAPSFSALVEQSPDAIARYDHTLRYVYVNPATEREWGFAANEMIGKTDRELGIPEDQLLVWEMALQQTFASNQMQILELSIPFTHQLRYFQARLVPEVGLSGDVEFVVSICRNITERKQAEEDTKLLQTMTQAIFESEDFHSALHVALQKVCEATRWDFGEAWVPNADQTFLESSSAFYSKHESLLAFRQLSQNFTFAPGVGIPGRVWRSQKPEWCQDVSAQPETIYLRAQMAQEFGLKAALGIPILTHKEVLTVLVFYMFEAREEDERLIQLISASTELGLFIQRKQAESEVLQSLIKERELNQLKSNFITMVSHEFRTPLSIIVLSTEVLERYGDQYEADKKKTYLQRIHMSTKRMSQLLENVLLAGQAEAGKLTFNPAPLDLETFCRDLMAYLQPEENSARPIIFSYQPKQQKFCLDENLLQHILSNLLSNAIKYSPDGSEIEFDVTLEETHQASDVVFRIQDRGIGIPLADQRRLFEPFHRAKNVSSISGTGLGLSIVKQCVDLHQGRISVSSEVGVGTLFKVCLPLLGIEGSRGYGNNSDY